jgi:hypothetical protein
MEYLVSTLLCDSMSGAISTGESGGEVFDIKHLALL